MSESELPRYLLQLEEALDDLPDDADAMLLSEVDGYVTGLALLPEAIPDEEWLPAIWRTNPAAPDYLFHDAALLDDIAGHATRHFRTVQRDLHRGEFEPIYDIDPHDEILWEFWMSGFGRAMLLRPEALDAIEPTDEAASAALGGIFLLAGLAEDATGPDGERDAGADAPPRSGGEDVDDDPFAAISEDEKQVLRAEAPNLIPTFVAALYDWTRERRPTPEFAIPSRSSKVGRNDSCPCGSGKKYKKCCGAAV